MPPPPLRDRMAGRHHVQCPRCRTGRTWGPDCIGGPVTTRQRRRIENRQLQRWLARTDSPDSNDTNGA